MAENFFHKIRIDLNESQINWKVIISVIPIAFMTYLFHESGHWAFGEIFGNDMTLSLNNSTPIDGHFINDESALWSAIGGPLFTIIQGLIFLLITWKTKSIISYTFVFFASFSRFFSIVFGGLNQQDEARIASMLDVNKFLVAISVLTILFFILWKSHRILKLNSKALGYFVVLGVLSMLFVIGVNDMIK